MPPLDRIKFTREHCIKTICFVLRSCGNSKLPIWMIRYLQELLANSITQLNRLAVACGLSLGAFLTLSDTAHADTSANELKSSIAFDIDDDGDPDILDADSSTGSLFALRNSGLSFAKENLYSPDFDADLVGIADVDGDGDDDIVILDQDNGSFQILDNQGSEGFAALDSSDLQTSVKQAFLSDVDQDGDSDLIYSTPNAIGWSKNNGSDGFAAQSPIASNLGEVTALEIGDFDEDEQDDLFYATSDSSLIGFVKNQGSEGFAPQNTSSYVSDVSDLEIADLDSDGHNDLVYSSDSSSAIGWMKNNGSDGFLPATTLASGIVSVDQIEVADLDNDMDLDIVGASSESSSRAWLENNGSEGFIPHQLG